MDNKFTSESSYLAWKMFEKTGDVGFYMLYSHIENPPKELIYIEENEREL